MSRADVALADIEQQVVKKLDKLKARTAIFSASTCCGGNGLIYVGPQDQDVQPAQLLRSRDPEGNVSEIVVREEVSGVPAPGTNTKDSAGTTPTDVYTWVKFKPEEDRVGGTRSMRQEDPRLPRLQPDGACPDCRLYQVAGESYGRSLVDDVIGDLSHWSRSPGPLLRQPDRR